MTDGSDTRTALLRAARGLFARQGYRGASVRAITSRAHANLGAVTYHFGTKQRLYEAVLESIAQPLVGRIRRAAGTGASPMDALEGIIRAIFAHWEANPDWPALMAHELSLDHPIPPPLRAAVGEMVEIVSGLVRRGQEQGAIVDGDPRWMTFSVVSQPMYLALASRRMRDVLRVDPRDAAVRATLVEHVVASVRRSLARPGGFS